MFDSNNFLDYMILQRIVTSIISSLTVIPVYYLCKRFFDNPFAIIGALIFAFEPHLILNSILGITEPIFILLTTIAIIFILNSKLQINYLAFIFGALTVLVRSDGIILFLPLTILFLITHRKNKKKILHYPILCLIFVMVLTPMILHNMEVTGYDGIFSRVIHETKINPNENNIENVNESINIYKKIIKFLTIYGWTLIPTFILFLPLGLFYIIKNHKFDDLSIITLFITMMFPVAYALSFLPDTRYAYFTFPILIVISLYAIKNIQNKIKKKNLILIVLISGILISSFVFIEFKKMNISEETETLVLARHIVESTKIINQHIPNSGYIPIIGMENLEKFPILRETFEQGNSMEYCIDIHICSSIKIINHNKIDEFMESSRINGLTHVIINEDNLEEELFDNIFSNEESFPYLKQEFNSREEGFSQHLKIFEIDYRKYDNMR